MFVNLRSAGKNLFLLLSAFAVCESLISFFLMSNGGKEAKYLSREEML